MPYPAKRSTLLEEFIEAEITRRTAEKKSLELREALGLPMPRQVRGPGKKYLSEAAEDAISTGRGTMSAAGRLAISKATKARWARIKKEQAEQVSAALAKKSTRTFSPTTLKRLRATAANARRVLAEKRELASKAPTKKPPSAKMLQAMRDNIAKGRATLAKKHLLAKREAALVAKIERAKQRTNAKLIEPASATV